MDVITAQSQPSHGAPMSLRTDRLECCASCCFGGPALCREFSIEKRVKHLVNLHIPYFIFRRHLRFQPMSQCFCEPNSTRFPLTVLCVEQRGFLFSICILCRLCYLHKLLSERPIWAWRSGALLSIKTRVLSQLLLPDGTAVHNNKHN